MDPRCDFVVRCTREVLRLESGDANRWLRAPSDLLASFTASAELRNFVEDPACGVLQVSAVRQAGANGRELVFSNAVSLASDADAGLVFTKRSTVPITAEKVEDVVVVTRDGDAAARFRDGDAPARFARVAP